MPQLRGLGILVTGAGSGIGRAISARFVEELNALRARAGLAAVSYAESESATAARVAPHYFGALLGTGPETVADVVMLGLIAGYDVPDR